MAPITYGMEAQGLLWAYKTPGAWLGCLSSPAPQLPAPGAPHSSHGEFLPIFPTHLGSSFSLECSLLSSNMWLIHEDAAL